MLFLFLLFVQWIQAQLIANSTSDFFVLNTTSLPSTTIPTTGTTQSIVQKTTFTVGMIVTEVQQQQIGYSITGGVIAVALGEIARIHLLDTIEFEFIVNYTDCTEANAAGVAVYLMKERNVDVVLGPACGAAIIPVGFLSTYYETLQVAWGFASAATLSDTTRFPYLSTVVPNYKQLGYAFNSLLQMFNWDTMALFYGDDGYGACIDMMSDVADALTDPIFNSTSIASTQKVDLTSGTRQPMITALQKLRARARIIGVLDNVRDAPLYCNTTDCLQNDSKYTGGIGSFAQQLYDAFMYYAYCLNASMALDPINGARNQTVFQAVRNTVAFSGWSGAIAMTPNATRVPRFFLYGVTITGLTTRFVNFTWAGQGDYMISTPTFTDEASSIWAARGGARPLSTPICGFLGTDCPLTTWEQNGIYICVGGGVLILLVLLFSVLLVYITREKRKERERLDAEWQIPYVILDRAGEPVSAYKYKTIPKLVNEDFAEFRMLRKLENDNVHRFIGVCHDHAPMMSIWKFASRGTLDEVVAKGFHGNLCSQTCWIDERKGVFDLENRNEKIEELLYMIKRGSSIPMRPNLNVPEEMELNPAVLHMIRDCWSDSPDARPTISTIKTIIKSMAQSDGGQQNLMDHVFNLMESYAETLEKEVQDRMTELVEEKKKSDLLLYRMLPKQVADRLKLGQSVEPESFDSVTIFFSDVVQFTNLAAKCSPLQIVNLLNDLYTIFDQIIEQHSIYKVETIGDGYLCVSGLPYRNGIQHVKEIAEMSLDFLRAVQIFRIPHLPSEKINLRIGMHSGSCVSGVVGLAMPRYCLFGDTVNTASRMESNGKPGRIHMSFDAVDLLNRIGGYEVEPRGEVIIKGKGVMETFWLNGRSEIGGMTSIVSRAVPPPPPALSDDRVFHNQHTATRESTPTMQNETRLPSAGSPGPALPNYDEAKGMYRQQINWQ
ncbi:unnamed protein product, partial [Mesorhabditis belari]|uniref:guanylate cyclase n=1 Tax=Mesorhabditis belari TaxID=2138241 RepID=A0AAF3EJP6_9BILA